MSVFPTNLDTFTTKSNGDTIKPAHVNDLQDAVAAIEAKVGVDGSSVATSHAKKIADMLTILGSCTAADLQKLHDLTATALELNIMDGVTATAAELNIMAGVTATATEINTAVDAIKAATMQGDLLVRGASVIERMAAVATGSYLKSAGASTKPTYGKLALRDTGVKIKSWTHTAGLQGDQAVTGVGFQPSVVILFAFNGGLGGSGSDGFLGFDTASERFGVNIDSGDGSMYATSQYYSLFNSTPYVGACFLSFDSDGGTLRWTSHDLSMGDLTIVGLFLP